MINQETLESETPEKSLKKTVMRQGKEICQIKHKFCKKKHFGFLGDCAPCQEKT